MTEGPPPEPGVSLPDDDRAVSTTLGYTLTLSITAVLIAGLLTAGGALIEDQRRAVVSDELTVAGQQLASGFEDANRLAGTTENGTVRVNIWLPSDVGGGGEYTLQLVNHPTRERATIVASAGNVDVSRNVSFRTEYAVPNRTFLGGPVELVYTATAGEEGDWRIVPDRGGTAEATDVDDREQDIVYVDATDGTLRYATLGMDAGGIESGDETVRADESAGVA